MNSPFPRPFRSVLLISAASGFALLLTCTVCISQTVSVDRAQTAQDQTGFSTDSSAESGFTSTGHAVSTPNDPDLGEQEILGRGEDRYQPFGLSVTAPVFYTSNAALTRFDPKGDVFFAPSASFTYQPRFSPNLYGDVAVQQQFFYYNRFGELDFGSFDARAGLVYLVPQLHNLAVRLAYDYNRLTVSDSLNEELFADQSVILTGEVPFRFSGGQQLSVGGGARVSVFGDPDPPRRDEFDLYLSYSIQATKALSFSALGRVVVREYVLSDRLDVSESFSTSVSYRVNKWASASIFTTVAANESNDKEFDYSVANLGGGLSLLIKF